MKTTLDGVVFLLPHRSSHAKTEFHRRRIFPGPREEGRNSMRHPGESCRTRTVGRQDRAAGQSGRTGRQDEAAGRSGRTGRQNGAARRSGKTERQKKRGRAKPGHRSGQVRGRRPHKQKTGETIGPTRFSTGIPTAGSRRTAKKRTEKRPGICKRPTHRFSIRCSDTGKGAILSARPPLVK